MNILLLGLSLTSICYLNGLEEENMFSDKVPMDLESLPLKKLLEMKKELRKKDDSTSMTQRMSAAVLQEVDARTETHPNAMALMPMPDSRESSSASSSSVQTAFQMSLTVLSFLAFGGYVISLVAQNMRKLQHNDGMTAPKPLKSVLVNQNRRPIMRTPTTVSFGRRKRSRRYIYKRVDGASN